LRAARRVAGGALRRFRRAVVVAFLSSSPLFFVWLCVTIFEVRLSAERLFFVFAVNLLMVFICVLCVYWFYAGNLIGLWAMAVAGDVKDCYNVRM